MPGESSGAMVTVSLNEEFCAAMVAIAINCHFGTPASKNTTLSVNELLSDIADRLGNHPSQYDPTSNDAMSVDAVHHDFVLFKHDIEEHKCVEVIHKQVKRGTGLN